MKQRVVWWMLVGLLCGSPAFAQELFETATLQNAAVATGNGTVLAVDRFTSVGLQVTIATTATVTFEVTQDGTTWASATCVSVANTSGTLVSTATATGTYQCNVAGMMQFRARISAWTSGAVTVTARATTAIFSKKGGSGGGVATTDIDTCAENAAIWTDETGTCGGPVLSQAPTIDSAVLTTKVRLPRVTALPGGPTTGDTVIVTDDSATGACDSAAGASTTICQYNGSAWVAIGDGGVGGSGLTHPQVMARASMGF